MGAGIWFWLIFVLCVIAAACGYYFMWPIHGNFVVVFILLGLLGWKTFGPPVTNGSTPRQ